MNKKYEELTLAPFKFTSPAIEDSDKFTLLLFLPQVLMLCITKSGYSLGIIFTSICASIIASIIDSFIRKQKIHITYTIYLQGLLVGLFIPSGYPIFSVFLISLISLIVTKYAFGGFGQSWLNASACTVIMLYLFGTSYFPGFLVTTAHLQNQNIAEVLVQDGILHEISTDSSISAFLNNEVLKFCGISIPEGYVSLLWDTGSVIPAFRFNLLTLLATLVLLSFNYIKGLIPVFYIAVYSILVRIFGLYPYAGLIGQGDILFALCTSGTIITAFFILPAAGTIPQSIIGKCVYGIIAGVISFLINGCGSAPIGSMFVVLVANIISPVIQYVEEFFYLQTLRHKKENN